jgi:hypothetical protein
VLDDLIGWYTDGAALGCQQYRVMRICRQDPHDSSYVSIRQDPQYMCTQDELRFYILSRADHSSPAIAALEQSCEASCEAWGPVYAVFLDHLGMTQLATRVREALPPPPPSPPRLPPPPPPPPLSPPAAANPETVGEAESQEELQLFAVSAGSLLALSCAACVCGAACCAGISRCRRTQGARYQKVELQDFDEPQQSDSDPAGASAVDILKAYRGSRRT